MFNNIYSNIGGDITENVTSEATLTDANNRVINIIAVDVQASIVVIHVTDKLVLPPLLYSLSKYCLDKLHFPKFID